MYTCNEWKKKYNFSKGITKIYELLYEKFGPQNWWPAESKEEIIIGAILTQAVSWNNVEKALNNLKENNLLDFKKISRIKKDKLALLIKPSGYYNMKAEKLKSFTSFFKDNYNFKFKEFSEGKLKQKREELLEIYGIGPETADSILLYGFNRPIFVIDTYTKRILSRVGYIKEKISYHKLQEKIENNLESDYQLYNEYHALLVKLAKDYCFKSSPLCSSCPLNIITEEEKYVNS